MQCNLKNFTAYLEEQAKNRSMYAWGAQGQKGKQITEAWIRSKEKNTGGYSNGPTYANAAVALWKKRVAEGYGDVMAAYDCSGLGMCFLHDLTGYYSGDKSANSMKAVCKTISRGELMPGDWVFRVYAADKYDSNGKRTAKKGDAYHIGYVVDEARNVIEAKGREDGVVKRPLNASGSGYWNAYGRPKVFAKEIESGAPEEPQGEEVLVLDDVNIRDRPDTSGHLVSIARKGEIYPLVATASTGWYKIGEDRYISNRADLTKLI